MFQDNVPRLEILLDRIYQHLSDVQEMKEFNQLLDEYVNIPNAKGGEKVYLK